MKQFFFGAAVALAVFFAVALVIMKLGIVGVSADVPPPSLEARLLSLALRASVARHAPAQANPFPPTDANLIAGAEIYRDTCARCHGKSNNATSIYGAAFYPPAPTLTARPTQYTEAELFWIVKHGIRNTGMPAWGSMLSDDELWRVAALLKRFDNLPPAVEAELKKR